MTNRNMQDTFWEVALTNDRDAFLRDKRGVKYTNTYHKGHAKPVRLDRSHKSTNYSVVTINRHQTRLDRLAGRIG